MERATASVAGTSAPAGDVPGLISLTAFHDWWSEQRRTGRFVVERMPFSKMDSWAFEPGTGNLRHVSGRFFSVEGLAVEEYGTLRWSQPIINQPEIGVLGILVKEFDGVLHCLMQAKMEPGNINTLQLSPTVQATRSNYTRVHRGGRTPYLEHFIGADRGDVLVDVLQSEQGAWYWRKRNRNMVVRATGDVPLADHCCWLSLDQIRRLIHVDNLVNMDARTVLSCLPFTLPGSARPEPCDPFGAALAGSYEHRDDDARHTLGEILTWFIEAKSGCHWRAGLVPLSGVAGWSRDDHEIADDEGKQFRIIAVDVRAASREVPGWTQPLLSPRGEGRALLLCRTIGGVLHVLIQARPEYGLMDMVEMAPTLHQPAGTEEWEAADPFVRDALVAPSATVRFDTVLSEEGGRFYNALTRYQIVEVGDDVPVETPGHFCWVTLRQVTDLLRHGHYLNIEARSLLACLRSLC